LLQSEPEFPENRVGRPEERNTMADRKNRVFTSKEKISALREHHLEGKPISAVCEKHQIAPSLFYYWQKQFFENGEAAFSKNRADGKQERELTQQVATLEEKLARKDAVIAEVAEEMVKLKKELGEL
jgi:transposase-like protein